MRDQSFVSNRDSDKFGYPCFQGNGNAILTIFPQCPSVCLSYPGHWNRNVILTKFASLAALKSVILTTSGAVSDENSIQMTSYLFQYYGTQTHFPHLFVTAPASHTCQVTLDISANQWGSRIYPGYPLAPGNIQGIHWLPEISRLSLTSKLIFFYQFSLTLDNFESSFDFPWWPL